MMDDIVGNNGSRFVIATAAVALGMLCLVVVLWFMRNRPSSPFIRGGKNRQPRLAVLDAAAIDTRRRLVLVRRDDIEHLIMIGGPTDIVIESRILPQPPGREMQNEPALAARSATPEPRTVPVRPQPAPPLQPAAVAAQSAVRTPSVHSSPALSTAPVAATVPTPPAISPTRAPLAAPVPVAAPPVSAMGSVLYADMNDAPPAAARPPARPSQPQAAQPLGIVPAAGRNPEDILDAARSRVLAPAPPSTPPATDTSASPPSVAPASQGAQDFERILDAEISGDLGRLESGRQRDRSAPVEPARMAADRSTLRHEPRLDTNPPARREPTIEDEMNRMLDEMAASKKP